MKRAAGGKALSSLRHSSRPTEARLRCMLGLRGVNNVPWREALASRCSDNALPPVASTTIQSDVTSTRAGAFGIQAASPPRFALQIASVVLKNQGLDKC